MGRVIHLEIGQDAKDIPNLDKAVLRTIHKESGMTSPEGRPHVFHAAAAGLSSQELDGFVRQDGLAASRREFLQDGGYFVGDISGE